MVGEVVDRLLDRLPIPEHVQMFHQEVRLERVGVVVVEERSFLERQFREMPVVVVVAGVGARPLLSGYASRRTDTMPDVSPLGRLPRLA